MQLPRTWVHLLLSETQRGAKHATTDCYADREACAMGASYLHSAPLLCRLLFSAKVTSIGITDDNRSNYFIGQNTSVLGLRTREGWRDLSRKPLERWLFGLLHQWTGDGQIGKVAMARAYQHS